MNLQSLCDRAVQFHKRGNLAEAERVCLQILAAEPLSFTPCHLLGIIRTGQGRNAEALKLIGTALKINPDDAQVLSSYGNVLKALGRFEEALASYDKALAIKPDFATALYNRGLALWDLERPSEALASYDKALAIKPDDSEALHNRGVALRFLGHPKQALASFDRALDVQPRSAGTWANRGIVLFDLEHFEEALASFDRALAIQPDAEVLNNRGATLRSLKRPGEALASYDRALTIKPDFAQALYNRAGTLRDLRRLDEAVLSFDRALAIDPAHAEAWNNRGNALRDLQRFDEALASYDKAIALRPDYAEAIYNRGAMQWAEKQLYEPAVRDFERAILIDPDSDYARGGLLHLRMYGADWRDFDREAALIDQGVRAGKRVAEPFIYQAISESPADLQACSVIYAEDRYPPAPAIRTGGRVHAKIRVGYLSGAFREQATAYLTAGLYEFHDRSKFEIIAFDTGWNDNSPIRKRLEGAFDKFIDLSRLHGGTAAEKIAAEETDILVNLNGYFGLPRMEIFAHRPAPIQVNYLGFPATLGARYIDYILADRFVIPKGERQFYTENVIWLPGSYQVNDSRRRVAEKIPARAGSGLPENAFVFCNFNQSYKLTPAMFALWMRILGQVEGSVLWLLEGPTEFSHNLRREAECRGVAGERIVFAPLIPIEQHLARMKLADLFLNSLPYNAHTTASDALWADLPLLTCRGKSFAGRVAASLLHAAGLPELVTENPEEYENLALRLARDAPLLHLLRDKLDRNRLTCALFDTDRFRRNIESAYTTIWEIRQRGESPRAFSVEG